MGTTPATIDLGEWPDGYLLLRGNRSRPGWVLDARTGEPVVALDGWVMSGQPGAPAPVLTRRDVRTGRTWIARPRPAAAELQLFAVDSPGRDCTARAGYLACTGRQPRAQVYRVG